MGTHLGRDIHPLRERTEIFILSFVHSDIWCHRTNESNLATGLRTLTGRPSSGDTLAASSRFFYYIKLPGSCLSRVLVVTCGCLVGIAVGIPVQNDAHVVAVRQRYLHSVDGAAAKRGDESLCGIYETCDSPGPRHTRWVDLATTSVSAVAGTTTSATASEVFSFSSTATSVSATGFTEPLSLYPGGKCSGRRSQSEVGCESR